GALFLEIAPSQRCRPFDREKGKRENLLANTRARANSEREKQMMAPENSGTFYGLRRALTRHGSSLLMEKG
ncbi:hypothetical protein Droror1_Dr00002243, partial [Drosera rotundifolia]